MKFNRLSKSFKGRRRGHEILQMKKAWSSLLRKKGIIHCPKYGQKNWQDVRCSDGVREEEIIVYNSTHCSLLEQEENLRLHGWRHRDTGSADDGFLQAANWNDSERRPNFLESGNPIHGRKSLESNQEKVIVCSCGNIRGFGLGPSRKNRSVEEEKNQTSTLPNRTGAEKECGMCSRIQLNAGEFITLCQHARKKWTGSESFRKFLCPLGSCRYRRVEERSTTRVINRARQKFAMIAH